MIHGIHGDLPTMDGAAIMATIHGIIHPISGHMRDTVIGIIIIIIITITMPTGMLLMAGDRSGIPGRHFQLRPFDRSFVDRLCERDFEIRLEQLPRQRIHLLARFELCGVPIA